MREIKDFKFEDLRVGMLIRLKTKKQLSEQFPDHLIDNILNELEPYLGKLQTVKEFLKTLPTKEKSSIKLFTAKDGHQLVDLELLLAHLDDFDNNWDRQMLSHISQEEQKLINSILKKATAKAHFYVPCKEIEIDTYKAPKMNYACCIDCPKLDDCLKETGVSK